MVSTRQMSTSGNGGQQQHNNHAVSNAEETARLSVVTRQTSSNYLLVNCSSILTTPPLRHINHTIARSSTSRHSHFSAENNSIGSAAIANDCSSNKVATRNLLDLPQEILDHILSHVTFKNVGQLRLVSRRMNDICMNKLNSTFNKLITLTYNRFQCIKASMPRRESARRNHPLSCESDIIETCYMRLSLLQMTFGKHIERGHCCFFPGGILDEVYTILNYIKNTPVLERPYRVTDELFDLSTMAMEYFKDRIEATLPDIAFNKDFYKMPIATQRSKLPLAIDIESDSSSNIPSPPQSNMVLRKGIRKIKQGMKIYNNQLSVLRNELRTCKRKSSEQTKQMAEHQKLLSEQQKQTLEYANRLDENDKKYEDMSRKFSTLLQELNKCKTELQYWRSKSPAVPICTSCGQKVVPILSPEDFQALTNQGIKPEDILNMNDEADTEFYNTVEKSSGKENTFAFPDEATTSKLTVITANKNKRQHASSSNTINTSAPISTNICNSDTCNTQQEHLNQTNANGKSNGIDLNNFKVMNAEACSSKSDTSNSSISTAGYPTKIFYGNNAGHKSVTIRTSALPKCENGTTPTVGMEWNLNLPNESGNNSADEDKNDNGCVTVEDVVSLQCITSCETKKARRVQKAARCLNASGKRSK